MSKELEELIKAKGRRTSMAAEALASTGAQPLAANGRIATERPSTVRSRS